MAISKKIQDEFLKQLNLEFYSGYLYLSMATYFDSINMHGLSSWAKAQSKEELKHGMKFFDHITEREGRVILDEIKSPPSKWTSALHAFESAYKHEQLVTGSINKLVDLAKSENDHAAETFLQWFVTEQVEEEASTKDIFDKLKLIGDDGAGLVALDSELGKRE